MILALTGSTEISLHSTVVIYIVQITRLMWGNYATLFSND